jgi:prevent-host-death family protein
MQSFNVADAKARLSEILERVAQGEEILLTRRGKPIARVLPAAGQTTANILGAGAHDPNINLEVLARDQWWKPLSDEESRAWYE